MNTKNLKREFATETVEKYRPYVKAIAFKLKSTLPANIEFDELIQWGTIGLLDALQKWDPSQQNKFKTYAEFRIRGAMLDGLRDADIVPRSVRDKQKVINRAQREVEARKKRSAHHADIAEQLGMSADEFRKFMNKADGAIEISEGHDHLFTPADRKALLVSTEKNSGDIVAKIEARQKLERIVKKCTPMERACFMLRYIWGLDGPEIAELFDCTESRVSQIVRTVHLREVEREWFKHGA